jgi:hypothetical protein
MKYVRALEYVLQNAPVRAKDPEKKVCIHLQGKEYSVKSRYPFLMNCDLEKGEGAGAA